MVAGAVTIMEISEVWRWINIYLVFPQLIPSTYSSNQA